MRPTTDMFLIVLLAMMAPFGSKDSKVIEAKVLELSDRFLPLRHDGMWLIMFYAPWCGHCKKLEPIWKHVDQYLTELPVRVGRIDCTRFSSVAQEMEINGFPTILFLKGDQTYTYEGDRTRDEIVAFAKRLVGPPVGTLLNLEDFEKAKQDSDIFFVFGGHPSGREWDDFLNVAINYQQHEFFYQAPLEIAKKIGGAKETQSVMVFKDGTSYVFEDPGSGEDENRAHRSLPLSDSVDGGTTVPTVPEGTRSENSSSSFSLVAWVNKERFPKFVKVTRGKFNHLLSTRKLLVVAVLEENRIGKMTPEMEEFRDMVYAVLEKNPEGYRAHFQFGWTGSPELANSVAMETLTLPHLIVINTTTYQHHLPHDDPAHLTTDAVRVFLDDILDGTAPFYGGSSYSVRLYRAYFEAKSSILELWKGNPTLAIVLFGLPLGFFALICYSICCADIMDAEEDDDEDGMFLASGSDNRHEKTE